MRRTLIVSILAVLAAPSAAAQITQADYVHTLSEFGGQPEVLETGSHFFGSSGRYRRDMVRDGERTSEILLLETGERITMNHNMRATQRGLLDRLWEIPSRLVRPRPSSRVPPPDLFERQAAAGIDVQRERLGRRVIGGLVASGSRNTFTYHDGRQRIIESWLVPVSRGAGVPPRPIAVERSLLTLEADGSEIGLERMSLVSTRQIPDDDLLFLPSGEYEIQEIGPRGRR